MLCEVVSRGWGECATHREDAGGVAAIDKGKGAVLSQLQLITAVVVGQQLQGAVLRCCDRRQLPGRRSACHIVLKGRCVCHHSDDMHSQ